MFDVVVMVSFLLGGQLKIDEHVVHEGLEVRGIHEGFWVDVTSEVVTVTRFLL